MQKSFYILRSIIYIYIQIQIVSSAVIDNTSIDDHNQLRKHIMIFKPICLHILQHVSKLTTIPFTFQIEISKKKKNNTLIRNLPSTFNIEYQLLLFLSIGLDNKNDQGRS